MKHVLLFLLISLSGFLSAQTIPQNPNKVDQNGKRQGKWTILYDKDWNIIQDAEKASFYRLIAYKDDKPVGKVYDKFADGKVQMEAELLADRPKDVMHGETIYYREDGTREKMQIYEQGVVVDEFVYDEKGNLLVENWQLLDSLGTLYKKQRNYGKAYELWERAKLKAAKEFGKKHENYITSLKRLGDLFLDLGRYAQAEPYYQAALEAQKARVGEKHEDYGKALNSLGIVYYRQGNYARAESIFSSVLEIYKVALGENNLNYAGMLHNLGVLNYEIGKLDITEKYCTEAMKIREKLVGKDHLDYANSLTVLGNLYNSRGNYKQGRALHEEATGIYKAKENNFYSSSLGNLAISYHHLNRYTVADSLYHEALAVIEKAFGKKHPSYARTLSHLGSLYKDMYKFDQAEAVLLEASQINKEILGEKHPQYARSLQTLAQLYIAKYDLSKAETLFQQEVNILRESIGEKNVQYAQALGDLATLYLRKDDISQAEPLFLKVLEILTEVTGKNHLHYAGYLSNLGVMYFNVNNFPKAEQCYQEALVIRANLLGKKSTDYAASLITLGNLYEAQEEYSKSISHFTEAIQVYLMNDGGKSTEYAYALNSLGNVYRENENIKKAEEYYLRSIEVYKTQHIENNLNFAASLNNISIIYRIKGEINKADSVLKEAVFLTEKYLGKNHPNYATFALNLAIVKQVLGDYQAAYTYFREVSDFHQTRIKNTFPALSQKEKELFVQNMRDHMNHFGSFSYLSQQTQFNESLGWLYDNNLSIKGLLLNTQNKIRTRVFASKDPTLQNLYHTWQSKRNILAQIYLMPVEEREQKGVELNQLEEEANQIEKELSKKSGIYSDLSETARYTWQQVREKLKPGEAAVEVLRFGFDDLIESTDSSYYAFLIVTPYTKEHPEMVVVKDAKAKEGIYLQDYKRNINLQRLDPDSYKRFWEVVQQKIGKVKKLYFSPDGVYHQINLSTLWNPATKKYLLEEMDIQILGSTKDIILKKEVPETQPKALTTTGDKKQAILLGHPKYDLSADQHQLISQNYTRERGEAQEFYTIDEEIAQIQWKELPGTEIEVRNIHNLLKSKSWESELYLNENALEEVVKQVQSPNVLHIATHGFFVQPIKKVKSDTTQFFETTDLDIDLLAIDNVSSDNRSVEKLKSNPMMLSGLVLSGVSNFDANSANNQLEDGILTAYEAAALNLDQTDLVVLSACQTGEGEVVYGEGVYGLQRGFQTAGAKTILMSLWNVSDEATQTLMTLFYENWIGKKQSKREAFKNAQQKLRKQYPSPFFWGAFVMIGE